VVTRDEGPPPQKKRGQKESQVSYALTALLAADFSALGIALKTAGLLLNSLHNQNHSAELSLSSNNLTYLMASAKFSD